MIRSALLAGLLVFASGALPLRGEEETVLSVDGIVEAARTVTLSPHRTGVLVELGVGVGDRVEAGQVLARMDAREAEMGVTDAELALAAGQLEVDLHRRHAAWCETVLTQASQDVVGVQESVGAMRARPEELEQARLAEAEARALVEAARLELRGGEIAVRRLEVALAAERLALERTRLVAPFSAVVVEVQAGVGESLRGHESKVVTLKDVSRLFATASVDDPRAWAPGTPVEVVATILGEEHRVEGRIDRTSPVCMPRTGASQVWVALEETKTRRLKPGQAVTLRIPLRTEEER